jgi:secondary thiamine-phosphate synthase enzyme
MTTAAPAWTYRHTRFQVPTQNPTEFIDITDQLEALISDARLDSGFANIQSMHTTTAIVVNEHEPLLLADFGELLERTARTGACYRHDDASVRTVNLIPGEPERANGHAHCRALLLSASACLNVAGGRLQLGRWQRVFLAELDGPRTRDVSVLLVGDAGR